MPWINVNGEPPKPTTFEDLGYVQVIRCKYCKHAEILKWLDGAIVCKKHSYTGVRPEEFFCADGEMGDKDA
jgi:hypothetical protein